MEDDGLVLFTVGHSTFDWPDFVALLKKYGVTAIADVRSQPVSRLPQYNMEALQVALKQAGIEYVFLGRELGARRHEPECYEDDLAVYERIADLPAFHAGLERIIRGLAKYRIALMCAEKEPLDCHRTVLISRHLRNYGFPIRHILADAGLEDHTTTERRLIKLTNTERTLFEPDLTENELLNQAYEARGREIAYRVISKGVNS